MPVRDDYEDDPGPTRHGSARLTCGHWADDDIVPEQQPCAGTRRAVCTCCAVCMFACEQRAARVRTEHGRKIAIGKMERGAKQLIGHRPAAGLDDELAYARKTSNDNT